MWAGLSNIEKDLGRLVAAILDQHERDVGRTIKLAGLIRRWCGGGRLSRERRAGSGGWAMSSLGSSL